MTCSNTLANNPSVAYMDEVDENTKYKQSAVIVSSSSSDLFTTYYSIGLRTVTIEQGALINIACGRRKW
jgi:hypothetical protein